MTPVPTQLEQLSELLQPIFIKNRVIKAVVFGSFARGSVTKKSDLDLLLVMHSEKRFFDRYDAFDEIHDLLRHTAVDMLIYTPDELEGISHRPFIKMILTEGQIIYEH